MKNYILNKISHALNSYVALDPESKERLQRLQNKVITIELLPLHLSLQCIFLDNRIQVNGNETLVSDATIRGTPLQMLGVMITKENRHKFFAEDIVIEGNAEVAQQVIHLFDQLDIDWEEQLSQIIGDSGAHHLGNFLRDVKSFIKKTDASVTNNINEYLHEELQWLPSREALQDLFKDIDDVRMATDRLEAKITQLTNKLENDEGNQ